MAGTGAAQVQNALARVDTVSSRIDSLIAVPRLKFDSIKGEVQAARDSIAHKLGFAGHLLNIPDLDFSLPEGTGGWMPRFESLKVDPELLMRKAGFTGVPADTGDFGRLKQFLSDAETKALAGPDLQGMAKDHFASRREALEKGIAEVDRYREKFQRLDSLPKVDLRFVNTMRGRPVRERILPGGWFRLVQRSGPVMEVAPFLRYQLTGRFSLGAGWSMRLRVEDRSLGKLASGPTAIAVARLGRNYEVHAEYRWMTRHLDGQGIRYTNFFTGLRKVFRVTRSITGFTAVQYDFNRRSLQLTPGDRLQTRMGLECRIGSGENSGHHQLK